MVLLLRVLVSSAGKVEAQPCVDFVWVGDGLVSVVGINFLGFALLLVVCSGFVVQDWNDSLAMALSCCECATYLHPSKFQPRLRWPSLPLPRALPSYPILLPFLPSDQTRPDRTNRRYRSHYQRGRKLCIREEPRCCRYRPLSAGGCCRGAEPNAYGRQERTIRSLASWSYSPESEYALRRGQPSRRRICCIVYLSLPSCRLVFLVY